MTSSDSDRSGTFPFGAYDIFSYIIPGLTALLCIFVFEHWIRLNVKVAPIRTPIHSMLLQLDGSITKDNFALSAVVLLALTCIVYVAGHLVSSISSFSLDRVYTAKGCGYPYERLLRIGSSSRPKVSDSQGFYQGLFFWLNVYLVMRFLASGSSQSDWMTWGSHILGSILCAVIAVKLLQGALRHRTARLSDCESRTGRAVSYFLASIFPSHLIILRLLQKYYRTESPFDEMFCSRYKAAFTKAFGLSAEQAGSNNFWFCRLFVIDKSPVINGYITYWLHMYTYARNLATAFYLAFAYCFLSFRIQRLAILKSGPYDVDTLRLVTLLFLLMSVILAARFRYIYVGYYNRFIFRSFVYLSEKPGRQVDAP